MFMTLIVFVTVIASIAGAWGLTRDALANQD